MHATESPFFTSRHPFVKNKNTSDLAPFVAAALRDKVVLDLQDEIVTVVSVLRWLRQPNENHRILALDALEGLSGKFRIAVSAPPNPNGEEEDAATRKVYAVSHVWTEGPDHFSEKFEEVSECTLGNLREAEIFINGTSCGRVGDLQVQWMFSIQFDRIEGREITSLADVLIPEDDRDHVCFVIDGFRAQEYDYGHIWCSIRVSKEQLFEFSGIDIEGFLANPTSVDADRNNIELEELISFFGTDALVTFDEMDGI